MIDAALSIAPDLRRRLVAAIRAGRIREPFNSMSLLRVIGNSGEADRIAQWLSCLMKDGVGLSGAAFALECIEELENRSLDPVVVWSGPEVPGVHSRDTRRVFEELFRTFKESLWISTYALYDAASLFETVAKRMDREPSLKVTILLNLMNSRRLDSNTAVLEFARKFWKRDWPGKSLPRVFYDERALRDGPDRAVLHAKGVVADGSTVFVTSANLTEAAFDRNIELGTLLHDRSMGLSVIRHFERLIETKMLSPLPG